MSGLNERAIRRCACGTELAPGLLACPVCHRLVHAERLAGLVREAEAFEAAGDARGALASLREALPLLPAASRQYARLRARATRLSDAIDAGPSLSRAHPPGKATEPVLASERAAASPTPLLKAGALAGGLALLLWKFKFVVVFLATKAKLLLVGLSKSTTLFSMLLSLGLYWTLWGWPFALGVVLSIYVHEMGHVAALRHFGIPASAPMFLPGLGAVVRMDAYPQTAREDARIGLAGPIWGLGCAAIVALAHLITGVPLLAAIARVGAWINLFNLVPIWQLDGGRGFRALSRHGRIGILVLVAGCGVALEEGLYVLIGLAALVQIFGRDAPAQSDRRTLLELGFLLVALGLLSRLPVPTPA